MTYGKVTATVFASVLVALAVLVAIGQTSLPQYYTRHGSFVSSFGAPWYAIVESTANDSYTGTGPEAIDAATIDNPDADITNDTRLLFNRDSNPAGTENQSLKLQGQYLMFCLEASANNTTGSVTFQVFGRFDDPTTATDDGDDHWQLLPFQDTTNSITLTIGATDTTNGTLRWTTPVYEADVLDVAGCNVFKVGITSAFTGNGTLTATRILVKGI